MSDTSSIAESPIPTSAPSMMGLNDFSDRLPPMLVKELRQGMRARTFVAVFLGLQCFLALVMLFATTATSLTGTGSVVSQIIFLFFCLAVLVVQPLRAMNALHGEIKSTTIDMMVLTRLTARRIVAGKWASIVAQTLLLLVSIIPYLILRYFFGGMNLFAELLALFSIAILSACLTAVNVGLSSNGSLLVRSFLPLAAALMMFSFSMSIMGSFDEIIQFFSLEQVDSIALYIGLLIGSLYLAWNFFFLGVKTIAPMSENHSSLNRVVCLFTMLLVAGLVLWGSSDYAPLPFLLGGIAFPAALLALTEPNSMMPRLAMPFVKRGRLGQMVGAIFYPCWTAGVHFTALLVLILSAVSAAIAWLVPSSGFGDSECTIMCSLIGSALFPALFVAVWQKRNANPLGLYIAVLIGSFSVMLALVALAESTDTEGAMMLFFWLPPVHLYLLGESNFEDSTILVMSGTVAGTYLLLLLIHGWKKASTIRQAEMQAKELLANPPKKIDESSDAGLAE